MGHDAGHDETADGLLRRIGERVRAARLAQRLTVHQAATRAALSVRFFADLEAGRANIAVARLDRAARALGLSLAALVADDGAARAGIVGLLGLRGAGKSTLGRRLAERLGREFVELDERIEREAGLGLAEIFALHGEGFYRRLEIRCLTALIEARRPVVVALSGGVVHNHAAVELLERRCITVWLRAAPDDHMARVRAQGDARPMRDRADAVAELRALLAAREPLYGRADVRVETSGRTVAATLRELSRRVAELGAAPA